MLITACCPFLLLKLVTTLAKNGLLLAESESDMLFEDGLASVRSPVRACQHITMPRLVQTFVMLTAFAGLVRSSCACITALPSFMCCIQRST